LGTAWLLEPDEEMLARLALLPGLSAVCADLTPDEAALEYSWVVLQLVPPYASLFLDDDAMLNSNYTEQVELEYRRSGFVIRPEWRAGPADHLGIELHYVAYLLEHEPERVLAFLESHLLPWAPVCLLAIRRIEAAQLYPPLAVVTVDVLRELGESRGSAA
jgi:TorA maturation chaperone TorD